VSVVAHSYKEGVDRSEQEASCHRSFPYLPTMATFFRRVLGNFYEPAVAPLVVCLATGLSFGVYSSVRSFYHPGIAKKK